MICSLLMTHFNDIGVKYFKGLGMTDEINDDKDLNGVLQYTDDIRRGLINKMVAGGEYPIDPKSQKVLLTALSDMDKTALGRARLKQDDKNADKDRAIASALLSTVQSFGNANPFRADTARGENGINTEQLAIPKFEPNPGETDVGIKDEDYQSFADKWEDANPTT